jgi:parvulin-like peptidyl-prolyl isomerase
MSRLSRLRRLKLRAHCLLLFCLASVGCAGSTQQQRSNASSNTAGLPPIVATINDRPLSTKLYEMYLKNGRDELGIDPNTDEGRRKLDQLREGIVFELIDRTLIAQEAERRGLSISAEKMSRAEQRTIKDFGGDERYDAYLAEHHLTRDEYREVIKLEVYGSLLREELNRELTVTDEEAKKYYEAHKGDAWMQMPERVTASHILIDARPNLISQQLGREKHLSGDALAAAVSAEVERRRKAAEELRSQAAAGADFAALARRSSEDPSSREQGGSLGSFTRDTHTRAFDEAAFALKPGAVSAVVQTDFGFHVIKVSAHEQARVMTLEEATPEIRRRLMSEREAARLTEWLKEARRKARIHINEPFRTGALKTEFPAD